MGLCAGGAWVPWHGDPCPVDAATLVEYRMRCGITVVRACRADEIRWSHNGSASDVVAYRVKSS